MRGYFFYAGTDYLRYIVFRLEFRVPIRWSVATVGDPQAVEDFQATDEGGQRTVVVNLKTKALGNFRLPFRLTAQGSAVAGEAVGTVVGQKR